jgi:hypothetical protein
VIVRAWSYDIHQVFAVEYDNVLGLCAKELVLIE